jgi:hypothetical protein
LISCREDDPADDQGSSDWYKPVPEVSFDWDLRSDIPVDMIYNAEVIDLDAFDTSVELIDALHAQGKKVFAYVSVGSWEDWRPDAGSFPNEVIGNSYPGWEGEKFLDIRQIDLLAPIMKARFDMIKEKGFDGIEPDNIDLNSWTVEELGFPISDADVITYSQWLAQQAHNRGLSIGQKNASDLAEQLVNTFDWILLEDAFYEGTQDDAQVYIQHNKAVFATEYTDNFTQSYLFTGEVCNEASQLHYTAILKHRELDEFILTCGD